jgi:predicted ester cyclase
MNHGRHAQGQWVVIVTLLSAALAACHSVETAMDVAKLKEFGTKYTAAWCSQNAASVAAFFAESGSLKINDGAPSVGRTAITAAAQGFMSAFPDMVVTMDSVSLDGGRAVYRWTLTGTNTGPGGTGRAVRISGYEEWTFGADGLIAESKGHFDQAEYERQLVQTNRLTSRCSRRAAGGKVE